MHEIASPRWKKLRFKLLIVLMLAQALFLGGITVSSYAVGWYGQEVRLQTVPIDPHDFLYGDYVTLNYDISRLKSSLWKGTSKIPTQGESVYVVLRPKSSDTNATFEALAIYGQKPTIAKTEVILKGKVNYSYEDTIQIQYGIEKYYVPESTGKDLEKQVGQMIVKIKVASWGNKIEALELSKQG